MQNLLARACRLAQQCDISRPADAERLDAALLRLAQVANPAALQQQIAALQQQMGVITQRMQRLEEGQQQQHTQQPVNTNAEMPANEVAPEAASMDASPQAQSASVML